MTGAGHKTTDNLKISPKSYIHVCTDAGAGAYEAFPDVCRLSDGRLICNFFSLRKTDQAGQQWTGLGSWMVTSDDQGQTWSTPQQIARHAYCILRSVYCPTND